MLPALIGRYFSVKHYCCANKTKKLTTFDEELARDRFDKKGHLNIHPQFRCRLNKGTSFDIFNLNIFSKFGHLFRGKLVVS